MQIAPPAALRRWGDWFAPRSDDRDTLRRSLLPWATRTLRALILRADLPAFGLDPQTMHLTPPDAEARGQARARAARAADVAIGEWEINGWFHSKRFLGASHLSVQRIAAAHSRCTRARTREVDPQVTNQTPAPRYRSPRNAKSRPRCSLDRAVNGRGGTSAQCAACREHRDATPKGRTLASTPVCCQD